MRTRRFTILAALFVLCGAFGPSATAQSPKPDKKGWIELFNGKNLDGWRSYKRADATGTRWVVEDGQLTLKINKQIRQITYELTYEFPDAAATPIVGTQFVNQAHLHFGQKHTTGAINVWLCQSADNPAPAAVAAGTPVCPSPSGTVAGSITPANVLALPQQGFPGGEQGFNALLAALGSDAIYANVHTDRFPPGEIRGQVGDRKHD